MDLSVIESEHEWARLEPEWNRLLAKSSSNTVFLTYEWLSSWWQAYGDGRQLRIIVGRGASGSLIGIAPFCLEPVKVLPGWTIHTLRYIGDGSGDSDYLDIFVADGSEEEFCLCVVGLLAERQAEWELCELSMVPESSTCLGPLLAAAEQVGLSVHRSTWPCSCVTLDSDWDAFLSRLGKKRRANLRQEMRRIQKAGDVRMTILDSEAEVDEALDSLFDLHQARWQSLGMPGAFGNKPRRNFYRVVARRFLERGWLKLYSLLFNGEVVAHQFCFEYGDRVYCLQEGYDPEYARLSVGNVLRCLAFQDCMDRGVAHYDFLGGISDHKRQWGAEEGTCHNVVLVADRLKARVAYGIPRAALSLRGVMRSLTPKPVLEAKRSLQSAYRNWRARRATRS